MEKKRDENDTTLTIEGNMAVTFREIAEFASSIESRPLDKLVRDLPGLAQLSEMKFNVVRKVLQRRMRELPQIEQEQLRIFANEISSTADGAAQERIRSVFAPLDAS